MGAVHLYSIIAIGKRGSQMIEALVEKLACNTLKRMVNLATTKLLNRDMTRSSSSLL